MRIDAHTPTHFETVEDGLNAELAMLTAVSEGKISHVSLAWTTNQSLVVPSQVTRRAGYSNAALRSASRGWPVAIRRTGGGTTPQGPGVLNVAIAFELEESARVDNAYATICDPIVAALRNFDLDASVGPVEGAFCDGDFNVLVEGRKIAGTAQRWRRCRASDHQAVLAHALILVDCEISDVVEAVSAFEDSLRTGFVPRNGAHIALGDRLSEDQRANAISDLLARLRQNSKPFELPSTAQRSGVATEMSRIEEDARREWVALTGS